MVYKIDPELLMINGIADIKGKYLFRAIVMEAVKAAANHVSKDDIEHELSVVYNTMVAD